MEVACSIMADIRLGVAEHLNNENEGKTPKKTRSHYGRGRRIPQRAMNECSAVVFTFFFGGGVWGWFQEALRRGYLVVRFCTPPSGGSESKPIGRLLKSMLYKLTCTEPTRRRATHGRIEHPPKHQRRLPSTPDGNVVRTDWPGGGPPRACGRTGVRQDAT